MEASVGAASCTVSQLDISVNPQLAAMQNKDANLAAATESVDRAELVFAAEVTTGSETKEKPTLMTLPTGERHAACR